MCPSPCTRCHTEWRNAAEWFIQQYATLHEITRDEAMADYQEARNEREA